VQRLAEVLLSSLARLVRTGCVIAALAIGIQAQEPRSDGSIPSEEILQNWLRSGDPRLEAWGAHDVLLTHDQKLVPDLLSLTEKWEPLQRQTCTAAPCSVLSQDQLDARDAMAATLDTLIQMKMMVRGEELRNLAQDLDREAAILLARLPDQDSTALRLDFYQSPPPPSHAVQYVSAALLALQPPPGFAADLLASIKVRGIVQIVLPGSPTTGWGTSGGSCGYARHVPRRDWPMTGQYAFSNKKEDGALLVVGGVDPLYAVRTESTYYTGDDCTPDIGLVPEGRRRFVAEMLGVSPDSLQWKTSFQTRIEFKSVDQTDADILNFLQKEQQAYRATANALFDRELMTVPEAETSLPEIELQIDDERGPDAAPIPALANLPPRVRRVKFPW